MGDWCTDSVEGGRRGHCGGGHRWWHSHGLTTGGGCRALVDGLICSNLRLFGVAGGCKNAPSSFFCVLSKRKLKGIANARVSSGGRRGKQNVRVVEAADDSEAKRRALPKVGYWRTSLSKKMIAAIICYAASLYEGWSPCDMRNT